MVRGVQGVLALALALVLGLALAPVDAVGLPAATRSTIQAIAPALTTADEQIGFTYERSNLLEVVVSQLFVPGAQPDTRRKAVYAEITSDESQASATQTGTQDQVGTAFISTRGADLDGEVWVDLASGNQQEPQQVTCDNTARENHPVVSPDGASVAYASDRDGNWDIYVAPVGDGSDCNSDDADKITDAESDDTWPSWLDSSTLVFSGSGASGLDLMWVASEGGEPTAIEDMPGDQTQPAVSPPRILPGESEPVHWIAFRNADQVEPDAQGLRVLQVPPDTDEWTGLGSGEVVVSDSRASEPSWSFTSDDEYFAWTTRSADPAGDVWVGSFDFTYMEVFGQEALASRAGVAETHPTWVQRFQGSEGGPQARLLISSVSADIDAVSTTNPTDRETLVSDLWSEEAGEGEASDQWAEPYDERQVAYSPDGKWIAYSRDPSPADLSTEWALVVRRTDGSEPPRELGGGRSGGDSDLDATWSPDGTEIAFTRWSDNYPHVRVVSADGGPSREITEQAGESGPSPVVGVHPAWSADGERIILARVIPESLGDFFNLTGDESIPHATENLMDLWAFDATNDGTPTQLTFGPCSPPEGCVKGGSPASSRQGLDVVFQRGGGLWLLKLATADSTTDECANAGASTAGEPLLPEAVLCLGAVPLTRAPQDFQAADPAWSGTGTRIGFTGFIKGRPDQSQIYTASPDGTGLVDVAQSRGRESEPAWHTPPATPLNPQTNLAVSVVIDQALGWVGGKRNVKVTVANTSLTPAESARLTVGFPAFVDVESTETCVEQEVPCDLGSIGPGQKRELTAVLTLTGAGKEPITAAVTTTTEESTLVDNLAELQLEVRQPVLQILPGVARPGRVVMAFGEDLPPRTQVSLQWDLGITVDSGPFRVRRNGTLVVPFLVLRRDRLGTRTLTVHSLVSEFSDLKAPVLVVQGLMAPPSFLGRG